MPLGPLGPSGAKDAQSAEQCEAPPRSTPGTGGQAPGRSRATQSAIWSDLIGEGSAAQRGTARTRPRIREVQAVQAVQARGPSLATSSSISETCTVTEGKSAEREKGGSVFEPAAVSLSRCLWPTLYILPSAVLAASSFQEGTCRRPACSRTWSGRWRPRRPAECRGTGA